MADSDYTPGATAEAAMDMSDSVETTRRRAESGPIEAGRRIEQALDGVMRRSEVGDAPPKLAAAMRHAVFPGGARVRPRLTLAVSKACGDDDPAAAEAAAAAVELLHCASLVHDDMPCFDDADTRRGRPSVHSAYGEPLALLCGDALIVAAFETISLGATRRPERLGGLILEVARSVGMPAGIVAGQGFESEPGTCVSRYQQAKTGALFVGSAAAGALAAGAPPEPWRRLGALLGEAYQVADDIRDVVEDASVMGKPQGRDAALGRPNVALERGLDGALARLKELIGAAVGSVPDCPGAGELRDLVTLQAKRLTPKSLAQSAA